MTWASKKQGRTMHIYSLEERGIGKWLKISVPQSVSATKKIKAQMVIYSFEIEKPLKHSRNFTSFFEERLIFFGFTQPSSKAASVQDLEMLFMSRLAQKVSTWSLGIKTVIYFPENPQYYSTNEMDLKIYVLRITTTVAFLRLFLPSVINDRATKASSQKAGNTL